jgi:Crp-like helix-turn-helix domain
VLLGSGAPLPASNNGRAGARPDHPISDFASLVGVTRQYASRFIGELRAAGVLEWRGSMISVKDVSRLSEMAGMPVN